MAERTPRQVIDAYIDAMNRADWDALRQLFADDYVEEYPQSGERIRGPENAVRVRANFPRTDMDSVPSPMVGARMTVGGEERWALAPNFTAIRVSADGDLVTSVARAIYPEGPWYVVYIGRIAAGKITRATAFFAQVFEPPPWRAPWVERIPESER
jgi:ketosteroid isomerase-like protein